MTKLLLDFHWELDSLFNRAEAFRVLYDFERLRKKEALDAVPFIAENDYHAFRDKPNANTAGSNLRPVLQFLQAYVRHSATTVPAVPISGPADLLDQWTFGLNDELQLGHWRTPQIIIPKERENLWKGSTIGERRRREVILRSGNSPKEHRRLIVILESYDAHLYARSDRAPWDLQRRKPSISDAAIHQRHPCSLPRPPVLKGIDLDHLGIEAAKIQNWKINGKCYFVPHKSWNPTEIGSEPWRGGHTFPHGTCPHCGKKWPIDRKKQIWCWDETHRHWDVQLKDGGYWSVSDDGTVIQKKDTIKKKKKGWR
jgi:hypothetical protein